MIPHYPRTLHVEDSGGGTSKHRCSFDEIVGLHLVVEEKVDGTHCGLAFDAGAELKIFSRNTVFGDHIPFEFSALAELAAIHHDALWEVLGDRHVLYGEWAALTHSIAYDRLPAFFLEDDIFDRAVGRFLSTRRRRVLSARLPPGFDHSVEVLHEGAVQELGQLHALVGTSCYKSAQWREHCGVGPGSGVEDSDAMEGLYIKVETADFVERRLKWVRRSFLEHIAGTRAHWRARGARHNALAQQE